MGSTCVERESASDRRRKNEGGIEARKRAVGAEETGPSFSGRVGLRINTKKV